MIRATYAVIQRSKIVVVVFRRSKWTWQHTNQRVLGARLTCNLRDVDGFSAGIVEDVKNLQVNRCSDRCKSGRLTVISQYF